MSFSHREMIPPDSLEVTKTATQRAVEEMNNHVKIVMNKFRPTCWRCTADGEGSQRGVQAIDSVIEMLCEEDMALHWLTGEGV